VSLVASANIDGALANIASALRTPVLVLALIALLLCALEAGRFAVEWWGRTKAGRGALRTLTERVLADPTKAPALAQRAPSSLAADALLQIARARTADDGSELEYALADYELAAQRRLDRTRLLVRAGPALGLMGTLIPLAPGLAALGHGDISALSSDLRTAFAATTLGLLVGTVAFALTLARTRMYSEDLSALERATGAASPSFAAATSATGRASAAALGAPRAPAAAAGPRTHAGVGHAEPVPSSSPTPASIPPPATVSASGAVPIPDPASTPLTRPRQ
jgi:biopolymer transport protein ExbB/TolQ